MFDNDYELQQLFRIWPNHKDAYLEVQVDGDGMMRVQTKNEAGEEYFGKVDLSIEPKIAIKLSEALKILADKEIKK